MKQLLLIISWEYVRNFKSRSFLMATFVSPILFTLIILLPSLWYQNSENTSVPVIGLVEFDSTKISEHIIQRYNDLASRRESREDDLQLSPVVADTPAYLKTRFDTENTMSLELDSLNDAYIKVKERRKYIFQKPKTQSQEKLLKETYEELKQTRESRDLAQLEYDRYQAANDSIWRSEILNKAEYLLSTKQIIGYLLLDREKMISDWIELYTTYPSGMLNLDLLKQSIQFVVTEERMKLEGIREEQIENWLQPTEIRLTHALGTDEVEFDLLYNYVAPVVVVLFLFISIFTSSGFLFNGILKEKTNRILEILISSVSHVQLIAGKMIGLGLLGLSQISLWFLITVALVFFNILPMEHLEFLNWQNAGYFVAYFLSGYLLFATIFVGMGSLFSSPEDAHHLHQIMRLISIFPLVLAVFVLESPNALMVRILSFIPLLTPTFMILRIPLGEPPVIDYYLTFGIMIFSILLGVFIAGRLFRYGSLLYGKKLKIKNIYNIILKGN